MKLDNRWLVGLGVLLSLILSFKLFGFVGLRTLLALIIIFIIPSYFILRTFDLETDEVVFISLFLGLSLGSLSVYYINRIIPSLTMSLGFMIVLGVLIGLFLHRRKQYSKK
jgi:uncharacterized membrane protein